MKPENKVSFQRIINATRYSLQGLKSAYINEAAFRQEIWGCMILIPLAMYIGDNAIEKLLLIGSIVIVLVTELLNSALETIVDRISLEYHELSGRAKDIGSAAVFVSMLLFVAVWLTILVKDKF